MRRVASALLVTIAMLASLFVASTPANATSAYDSLLSVTPKLEVYTDGNTMSQTMDISSTWWRDLKASYALRVAQGIPNYPTDFATKFESYVSGGGSWGVYSTDDTYGKTIAVFATDDPDAQCSFGGAISTGYYGCWADAGYGVVQASYFTHNSYGGNGCFAGCTANGMNLYAAPTVIAPSGSGHWAAVLSNTSPVVNHIYAWNFDNQYPSGYAGVILPTNKQSTNADYVAMGDSFSSGEGNAPFETLSDIQGINECHRSLNHSYSYVVSHDVGLGLSDLAFVACSGATTDTLLNGGSAEPAQTNALSSSTQAVTLTIGGNDLGFVEVLAACSNQLLGYNGWGCSEDSQLNDDLQDRLDALQGTAVSTVVGPNGREIHSILEVLEEIATKAPDASIYIAGYPKLFGSSIGDYEEDEDAPGDAVCAAGVGVNFSYQDTLWMNDWATSLNGVISSAVTDAQNEQIDVTYVTPGVFNGHGLCDTYTPYLYDVMLDSLYPNPTKVNPGSIHPDDTGAIIGYGAMFLYMMS